MAEVSAVANVITGSKIVFYQQNDDTIRIRIHDTDGSFQYEMIMAAATWTALKAALTTAGDEYTPTEELGFGGADHTVSA
jgi:hypothetical protein